MPPVPDKQLEQRILNAALRLCRSRGERGLTLRAVARTAGTTTPTVYKRFRNKEALRVALARHIWQSLVEEIIASPRIEDAYRRYLRFAEEHPAEYTLFSAVWSQLFVLEEQRPGEIWLRRQLANRFGGQPEEYISTYYALLLSCHGAAGLINQMTDERIRTEVRENCIAVCDAIVRHANLLRAPEESRRAMASNGSPAPEAEPSGASIK